MYSDFLLSPLHILSFSIMLEREISCCSTPNSETLSFTGIGGVELPEPQQKPSLQLSAAEFIASTARAHPQQITLITLGPLTNAAIALRLEPRLATLLQQWVLMGGVVSARGNKAICAEANVHNDPEAAR